MLKFQSKKDGFWISVNCFLQCHASSISLRSCENFMIIDLAIPEIIGEGWIYLAPPLFRRMLLSCHKEQMIFIVMEVVNWKSNDHAEEFPRNSIWKSTFLFLVDNVSGKKVARRKANAHDFSMFLPTSAEQAKKITPHLSFAIFQYLGTGMSHCISVLYPGLSMFHVYVCLSVSKYLRGSFIVFPLHEVGVKSKKSETSGILKKKS